MIPELNEGQNRRVIEENITLPFGHKWLSWAEYGNKPIPSRTKIYLTFFNCWKDDSNAGKTWDNNRAVLCIPMYPEIPAGFKLVEEEEVIKKGYKFCSKFFPEWLFDNPKGYRIGSAYEYKDWPTSQTFFINPIAEVNIPDTTLSDKVRELEKENATLKETVAIYKSENESLKSELDARAEEKRELQNKMRGLSITRDSCYNTIDTLRTHRDKLSKELSDIKEAWRRIF